MNPSHEQVPPPAAPVSNSGSVLLDEVEVRSHAAGNVAVDPKLLQQPLGEAPIGMAGAGAEEDIFQKEIEQARQNKNNPAAGPGSSPSPGTKPPGGAGKPPAGKAPGKDLSNPQLQGLSAEKSREAAENLARMILQGYAKATDFADQQLQVSEKRMLKIRSAGKIDMETPIPIEGGMVSFEDFIRTYNQQIRGTIGVEKEFIDDVLPKLTAVLAKHGQGLSDEQYLLAAFGSHIAYNTQKFLAMKSTMNQFMAYGMEMTKRNREMGAPPVVAMHAPVSRPPAPAPPPAPDPAPAPPPARVVTMHQQEPAAGATTEFQMPQWGSKEKMDAMKKAQNRKAKQNGKTSHDLTAAPPASRKKIRRAKKAI